VILGLERRIWEGRGVAGVPLLLLLLKVDGDMESDSEVEVEAPQGFSEVE
jgi:hypothetical protein